ncbi:hypothetical protein MED121_14554 [Marinomonas sp. MED121]|uniref:hypothetical protein n=1 Tax=Marinomonas sp. MED121 TaxID=314277 RepID=UPI0000690FEF|nr:hypothetical protein [Marinomonas sp. MED121]EAQ67156.1 hypothetical protein MED121_14554 [Marinomonas sp. MED121]
MSPPTHDLDHDISKFRQKPFLLCCFILLLTLITGHFLFIILIHHLDLMPKQMASSAFFSSNGFLLNFIGNIWLGSTLLIALIKMKKSGLFWSLALFIFDVCSTVFWIFTQNWLATAGALGLMLIGIVWGTCIACFIYLRYLNKLGKLD